MQNNSKNIIITISTIITIVVAIIITPLGA